MATASIAGGTIFVGGLITAAAAFGINVKFVRYILRPRRAAASSRTARLIAAMTFVESGLRLAVVAWAGLFVLFLGLAFDGKPRWIPAIPIVMVIWTAGVDRYLKRLLLAETIKSQSMGTETHDPLGSA